VLPATRHKWTRPA